jgi:hypothetical protein
MKLEQSFEVAAPIDEVWAARNDLFFSVLWERVRRHCLALRARHRFARGRSSAPR